MHKLGQLYRSMISKPDITITAYQAKEILGDGGPLINYRIEGSLEIDSGCDWEKVVLIENCIIENLKCVMVYFQKSVTVKNCHVKDASFSFSYFVGGLIIENCIFDSYLDFQSGGHNDVASISFSNNHFMNFVNFFDCWFTGELILENNTFEKGSNICSKGQLVSFDLPVRSSDDIGDLSIDNECRP